MLKRAGLGLLLALTGCGAIHFDVEQPLSEQRVAGNPLGLALPSLLPNPFRVTVDLAAETQPARDFTFDGQVVIDVRI